MASNVVSRQVIRDRLASHLTTALVGAGKLAQNVLNYRTDNFEGATPMVVVCSRGSDRDKMAEVSVVNTDVLLYIYTFVLYSDEDTWGPDDAEDRLDEIEKVISDTMYDNFHDDGYWISIDFDQQSQVETVVIGSLEYMREVFFVKADAYSD
jgi:hypothetical protein